MQITARRPASGSVLACLVALGIVALLCAGPAGAATTTAAASSATAASSTATQTTAATSLTPPATIKVARRFPANDPNGVIVAVDTVDFRTYCVRVLSHEWAPPSAFSDEALRAGALAVKAYAWYWATRPTKLADVAAWGANVDDTTNYQEYMDWDYGQRYRCRQATCEGPHPRRPGLPGLLLRGRYSGAPTDGNHMTQWGSQYWAAQGENYQSILDYYYPGSQLVASAGGSAVATGTTSSTAWSGPDAPKGTAKLDVIGPVQLSAGPYRQGQTLKADFTLRNDGATTGTWSSVTLVARAHDQVRDLGSVTSVTLKAGEYRLFTGHVKLDLAGPGGQADRRRRRHAGAARRRGAVRVRRSEGALGRQPTSSLPLRPA